jgi:hypothetical protein
MSPILGARGGLSASAYGFTSSIRVPGDYESIATVTLTSGSGVVFSSIPSTYKHLQIRGISPIATWIHLVVNGDTSITSYSYHEIRGNGGGNPTAAGNGSGDALLALGAGTTNPTSFVTDVSDYTSTNKYKTFRTLYGSDQNGSGNVGLTSNAYYGNTNAITSLGFYEYRGANLPVGTTIALYGIRG